MEIVPELRSAFPGLRVVELKLAGLTVSGSDPGLESFKLEVQERVRRRTASLEEVKDQPIFRAYRDFFWRVGIDPTKVQTGRRGPDEEDPRREGPAEGQHRRGRLQPGLGGDLDSDSRLRLEEGEGGQPW